MLMLARKALAAGGSLMGPLYLICLLAVSLLFVASISFAIEAWTGLPDLVTIPVALALVLLVPPLGGILGIVGLFYFPW